MAKMYIKNGRSMRRIEIPFQTHPRFLHDYNISLLTTNCKAAVPLRLP